MATEGHVENGTKWHQVPVTRAGGVIIGTLVGSVTIVQFLFSVYNNPLNKDIARVEAQIDALRRDHDVAMNRVDSRWLSSPNIAELNGAIQAEIKERQGEDNASRQQREEMIKRIDLERHWNEDQERRLTDIVQRLSRLEQAESDLNERLVRLESAHAKLTLREK